MKTIGKIRIGLSADNQFFIVENEQQYYLVRDIKKFSEASPGVQFNQKIHRIISHTIFLRNETLEVHAYSEEEKNTLKFMRENIFTSNDEKLIAIAVLCEGSDTSDLIKFKWTKEVVKYEELKDIGGNGLRYGLGFPGKAFGIVVAKTDFPVRKTSVFIQVVESYTEGYAVSHYELLPEMLAAFEKGLITEKNFSE
ncbi:hypothetical protein SDC9_17724 [bioreactor metagenome]|jgi:L-rhamnose mutarotase|uniref:Uncharacterized protein n=1 Tax=bioreactor metagenome TaxID=1076179 RepID=A0A644TYA0_9ZZZZ|nr:hypothetical protein [Lentimicrobium sp.]MEA5111638.1 hypothetical protein [Lentimicrobium sp.]